MSLHWRQQKPPLQVWVLIILAAIAALLVLIQSPAIPPSKGHPLTDSSVFQYIGTQILDGYMPYEDVFDHKGPLLYVIEAIGLSIHGQLGIWFVEFVVIFATIVLMGMSLWSLGVHGITGIIVPIIVCVFSIVQFLQAGNFTEEYILVFAMTGIYSAIYVVTHDKYISSRFILLGISFMAILLIKFNGVIFIIPFMLFSLFTCWRNKKLGLLKSILLLLLGMTILSAPILIWLVMGGALQAFYRDYFLYNILYAGHGTVLERLRSCFDLGSNFFFIAAVTCNVISIAVLRRQEGSYPIRELLISNLIGLLAGFIVTAGTGYAFGHYALLFSPYYLLPFGAALHIMLSGRFSREDIMSRVCLILVIIYCGVVPALNDGLKIMESTRTRSQQDAPLIAKVQELKTNDYIQCVGNACWLYLGTDAMSASIYPYLPAYLPDPQFYYKQIVEECIEDNASVVVVSSQHNQAFSQVESFKQNYRHVDTIGDWYIYTYTSA